MESVSLRNTLQAPIKHNDSYNSNTRPLHRFSPEQLKKLAQKLESSLKKGKSIKKTLQKVSEEPTTTLTIIVNSEPSFRRLIRELTQVCKKFVCPLTQRIIKVPARVYGTLYELSAIKEYVLKNNMTPDNILINLGTISNLNEIVMAIFQQDNEIGKII
mmetsp:Transcript_17364/g.31329  ORF Transcript_17364/g.31329 Transcript_17364/m.31329 type:complete len:159 (-) Transcript_17364:50-526(-)